MILDLLKTYVCLDDSHIESMVKKAQSTYKMYYIKKKNGGTRQIFHPSKETKVLQYALMDLFLNNIPISDCAKAYKKGIKSPLLSNAKIHAPYKYSIHIDFKEFFPSIKPDDLVNALKNEGFIFSEKDITLLKNILFLNFRGEEFLSIGAPASPICSNIVMKMFDLQFENTATKLNGKYSRYADDILFSTDEKKECEEFYKEVSEIIRKNESPKLKINNLKTHYQSRKGKRIITGLSITPSGDVVIPREKKRYIRSLLLRRKYGIINEKEEKYLKGYLSFIRDVEPDYINNLIIKYGEDTVLAKLNK
mgnify:CR=1 FL=1